MSESLYRDPAVAEIYRRVAVPTHFAPPARDLVSMLAVTAGERLLDVGTGTGVLATIASEAAGPAGLVVGVDRAAEMLRASDARGRYPVVVGQLPTLPLADDGFDAVGASFVLPHCRNWSSALADMVRVCRPAGRVGVTAWGSMASAVGRLWKEIVNNYVEPDQLAEAVRAVIPWEEWFYVPGNVERALDEAGLTAIQKATREYTIEMPTGDYLAMKKAGAEGRLVRQLAGKVAWDEFTRNVAAEFQRQFADSVSLVRDVHFGVGTKPSWAGRAAGAAA